MPITERMKYFQVDEKSDYECRCSNEKNLNYLSGSKTSDDSEITEIWKRSDEEYQVIFN